MTDLILSHTLFKARTEILPKSYYFEICQYTPMIAVVLSDTYDPTSLLFCSMLQNEAALQRVKCWTFSNKSQRQLYVGYHLVFNLLVKQEMLKIGRVIKVWGFLKWEYFFRTPDGFGWCSLPVGDLPYTYNCQRLVLLWCYIILLSNFLKIWDINSGNCRLTVKAHKGGIRALAFGSTGHRFIFSAADDRQLLCTDIEVNRVRLFIVIFYVVAAFALDFIRSCQKNAYASTELDLPKSFCKEEFSLFLSFFFLSYKMTWASPPLSRKYTNFVELKTSRVSKRTCVPFVWLLWRSHNFTCPVKHIVTLNSVVSTTGWIKTKLLRLLGCGNKTTRPMFKTKCWSIS